MGFFSYFFPQKSNQAIDQNNRNVSLPSQADNPQLIKQRLMAYQQCLNRLHALELQICMAMGGAGGSYCFSLPFLTILAFLLVDFFKTEWSKIHNDFIFHRNYLLHQYRFIMTAPGKGEDKLRTPIVQELISALGPYVDVELIHYWGNVNALNLTSDFKNQLLSLEKNTHKESLQYRIYIEGECYLGYFLFLHKDKLIALKNAFSHGAQAFMPQEQPRTC